MNKPSRADAMHRALQRLRRIDGWEDAKPVITIQVPVVTDADIDVLEAAAGWMNHKGLDPEITLEFLSPPRAQEAGRLRQAITEQPAHPALRTRYALLLYEQHELIAASDQLREAIRLDPSNWESYSVLGLVAADLEDLDASITAFRQAAQHTAEAAPGPSILDRLPSRPVPPASEAEFRKFAEATVRSYLGETLHQNGELVAATAEFDRAQELYGDCGRPELAEKVQQLKSRIAQDQGGASGGTSRYGRESSTGP
jgi:tetratricopeptide (TPR) repeat protein